MGCGCKKRKALAKQAALDKGETVESVPKAIVEERDYQRKVSEALKQFASLKLKKRNLRG